MYEVAICDDNSSFIEDMEQMLLASGLAREEAAFHEYSSGEELIQDCVNYEQIDLLILDIQMGGMDGNRTARQFRNHFPSSVLVFCSGVYGPTVNAFEAEPYRYLMKSYSDEQMGKELRAIIQEMKKRHGAPVIVGAWKQSMVRLRPEEILYISIERGGSRIYADPSVVKYGCLG